jgi:predicted dehydrogenase
MIASDRLPVRWMVLALLVSVGAMVTRDAVAQPRLNKDVYGIGILGNCCTHGTLVYDVLKKHPEVRVVAAYEANPGRAKELSDAIGRPLTASYQAVIDDPQVDIVAVTCDPCDKAGLVEQAARAGKHILLNKPACDSLGAARRIDRAVRQHPVWLVYDIPMVRFIPVYARLLEDVRDRPYGKVLGYHHQFGMNFDPTFDLKAAWPERLHPPQKSGGGEMTNMGCYAIDYAVSLLGKPRVVTAKWRKLWDVYRQADVENFGQIVLDYGDFFAYLDVGKQQLPPPSGHSNTLTLDFEHRTLLIDLNAQVVTVNHVAQDWNAFTKGAKAADAVDQIVAALRHGAAPSSGSHNMLDGTEVLMAAYASIVRGGPVSLPLRIEDNPLVRRKTSSVGAAVELPTQ